METPVLIGRELNQVMMTPDCCSLIESKSDSGYSSSTSLESLSNQVSDVVAALELINGHPEVIDRPDVFGDVPPSPGRDREADDSRSDTAAFLERSVGYHDDVKTSVTLPTGGVRYSSDAGSTEAEAERVCSDAPNYIGASGVVDAIRTAARKRNENEACIPDKDDGKEITSGETASTDRRSRHPARTGHNTKQEAGGKRLRSVHSHRETISRPPPHVLPPCKVCGVQATGFHYGVNTCEACKGFFRRSIIRKHPYVCAKNPAKCVIKPGKRKTCPLCRYMKCLEAGMSVDGIKIGRYTYAKRTQDILELRQAAMTSTQTSEDENVGEQDDPDTESDTVTEPEEDQRRDIVQFIDAVVKGNELKDPRSPQTTALIEQMQKEVKDMHAKGQLPARVPMDDFFNVLSTTGIQLDNRIEVLKEWVVLLNDGLKYLVNFAKTIPGFRDLKLSDQTALIKHSICEVWIISRYLAFHSDLDYFITVNGMAIDVIKMLGEDFGSSVMRVTRRLRSLDLTDEEIIILKAMVIFFTDRCEVQDAEKVTSIRDRLVESLLYLLNQRDANIALNVGRISAVLTELRLTTEMYFEYTRKLLIVSSKTGVMNFPPLLLEVMSFPDVS